MVAPVIYTSARRSRRSASCRASSRRGLVVPGLFRAGRRLRPRLAEDRAPMRDGDALHRQRPEDLDHARASTPTGSSSWCAPTPDGKPQAGISLPADRHEDARHHRAPDHHAGRRARGQRGLPRQRAGCRSRTASARRTRAGPAPSCCSPTSAAASPASRSSQARRWSSCADRRAELGRRRPLLDDPIFRAQLAELEIDLTALEYHRAAHARRPSSRQGPGAGGLDPQDQGHRDPAGHHRAADGGGRATTRALPARSLHAATRATSAPTTPRRWRRTTSTSARPRSTAARTRSSATSSPRWCWGLKRCETELSKADPAPDK